MTQTPATGHRNTGTCECCSAASDIPARVEFYRNVRAKFGTRPWPYCPSCLGDCSHEICPDMTATGIG